MSFGFFRRLFCRVRNVPVPGRDARWLQNCDVCDDMTGHVSRGGMRNGGTYHCYGCGTEGELKGFSQSDIDRMVLDARWHWKKFAAAPYHWHTLTEDEKWRILGMEAPK